MSLQDKKVRHRTPTAHERARYRCFLPDLAGLAGKRRAEPMPDSISYQEFAENRNGRRFRRRTHFCGRDVACRVSAAATTRSFSIIIALCLRQSAPNIKNLRSVRTAP